MEDLKKKILSCMADVIKQNGFRTEFFEAENGQQPMTRVELIVDMWFPPAKMAREETALFQMHATMLQVDSDAVSRNLPELKRALFIINNFCTIGQFGLFEQDGVVYMRHNIVVNMKDDPERIITDICDYFSLMLSSIQRFVDAIAQIAVGAVNIEVAKEMDLIPNI